MGNYEYRLLYGLINFAILAGGLGLVGRKLLPKIFGGRRREIESELKAADEAPARAEEVLRGLEAESAAGKAACEEILQTARDTAAREDEAAAAADRKVAEKLHQDSEDTVMHQVLVQRNDLARKAMRDVADRAAELLSRESASESRERLTEQLVRRVEENLHITQGERAAYEESGVLEAALFSAEPLTEGQLQRIRGAILRALKAAGAEASEDRLRLETGTDPALVGGLLLRIGDTVYDNSLKGMLSRIRDSVSIQTHDDKNIVRALKAELSKAAYTGRIDTDEIEAEIRKRAEQKAN